MIEEDICQISGGEAVQSEDRRVGYRCPSATWSIVSLQDSKVGEPYARRGLGVYREGGNTGVRDRKVRTIGCCTSRW